MVDLSAYDLFATVDALDQDYVQLAVSTMASAVFAVNADYPAGAVQWLKQHRPEIASELGVKTAQVDAAFGSGEYGRFRAAVQEWQRYHLRAWHVVREAAL